MLRGLTKVHEVALISFCDADTSVDRRTLESLCTSVRIVPRREFKPARPKAVLALLGRRPRVVADTYVKEMAVAIEAELETGSYDLVIASQWNTAAYARHFGGNKSLLEELEIGNFESKMKGATSAAARLRHALALAKMRSFIRSLLPLFAGCTVVSEREARLVDEIAKGIGPVDIVPNFVDLADYEQENGFPAPNRIVFSGSATFFPNLDGVQWFLREVFPVVRSEISNAELVITGKVNGNLIPPSDGVRLTGFVDDVRPIVSSAWMSVVPIRLGGGTRVKVLEAMALRTPVIATSKGVEGLDVVHGEHVLIADAPNEFAKAVIQLHKDYRLRERLSENAYALVQRKYDYATVMPQFLEVVEQASGASPGARTATLS